MTRATRIIIDTSVAAHQLHSSAYAAGIFHQSDPKLYESYVKAQLIWLFSGDWLGSLKPANSEMVFVGDMKPYWRSEYLLKPDVVASIPRPRKGKANHAKLNSLLAEQEEDGLDNRERSREILQLTEDLAVSYKGGRKASAHSFLILKQDMYRLIDEKGYRLWAQVGYEADDFAAAFVHQNSQLDPAQQSNIILATVDADWLGLVNDRVSWFCMKGYQPRYRADLGSINYWGTVKKGYRTMENPRDLWKIKNEEGDKSDNLPKGAPIEVIDLLEPPAEYRLWDQPIGTEIHDSLLIMPVNTVDPFTGMKATDWLKKHGFPRFIAPYSDGA